MLNHSTSNALIKKFLNDRKCIVPSTAHGMDFSIDVVAARLKEGYRIYYYDYCTGKRIGVIVCLENFNLSVLSVSTSFRVWIDFRKISGVLL